MKEQEGFLSGSDITFSGPGGLQMGNGDDSSTPAGFTEGHWLGANGFWTISGEYSFSPAISIDGRVIRFLKAS